MLVLVIATPEFQPLLSDRSGHGDDRERVKIRHEVVADVVQDPDDPLSTH